MSSMTRLTRLALLAAVCITPSLAHPLFSGKIIARVEDLKSQYDYVVVGAGASGLTVASRLSEQEDINVLIIEAGSFDLNEDIITIPGLAGGAVGTKYDWNSTYTATEGLNGRKVPLPQGKVVGGSTKLNRMVFDRGSKSDYDGWEILGNQGWNFEGLLPYFKKNEKFTPPTEEISAEYDIQDDPEFHGNEGLMHSTYSPFFWPTTKNFVKATKSLGIPINDQATGNAFGGYFCPHNLDPTNVTRSSADEAYYDTAAQRQNFHLITNQQATRILTENKNGAVKVVGIEFASSANSTRQTVKVQKEAIIAAGALHTPQLLQVSGIGDPALLKSIDVTPVVDLPAVGHNLHDHVSVAVINTINAPITINSLTTNATFAAEARAEYASTRRGPLSSPTGDFLLFLPVQTYTNTTTALSALAVAQNASVSLPLSAPPEVRKGYTATHASLAAKIAAPDAAFLEIIWADGAVVLGLQHPFSRGAVAARSASMFDAPAADAGFLRNPLDVALLREGVRFARRFVRADGLAELAAAEVMPGGDVVSDAGLEEWIRGAASTLYHPAGSCRMGRREEGGVVDKELRVYGVQGLRVVDASVMPVLPASHTMTTVYAVAERAADIIKRGAVGS